MCAAAPQVVLVFGDVGEMRKVAKGARDLCRMLVGQRGEQSFQLVARSEVVVAVKA
jgi:hypothetical protein